MKFAYSLIKKLGVKISEKQKLVEALNFHVFETVEIVSAQPGMIADGLEVSIPANRYSDASSHYGLSVLIFAITGKKVTTPKLFNLKSKPKSKNFTFTVANNKF